MSAKKRILFIANEMSPYLELTEFAETVNKLAIKSNDHGFEVRCIMPRFGVIKERDIACMKWFAYRALMCPLIMMIILYRSKWLPCPMQGCRCISWRMRTCS